MGGVGYYPHAFTMVGKFEHLAKSARERYKSLGDTEMAQQYSTNDSTVVAPPIAKKAKYLRDANGVIYLWTPDLALRGDLVAAYNPDNPDEYADDQKQIQLNRELEIARERADAEEVARLEAVKAKEKAEAERQEAEEIAQANQRNLDVAQRQLEEQREQHAKEMAEMQAKLDAMAKQVAVGQDDSVEEPEAKPEAKPKRKSPAKKAEKVVEEAQQEDNLNIDLDGLDD